jgi:hypothetical protein
MSRFDFIAKNLPILEELFSAEDGIIDVPLDEYDFSHNDMEADVDGDGVVFTVSISIFTLRCQVPRQELAAALPFMSKIGRPETREALINIIEQEIKPAAEEVFSDAKDDFQVASDAFTDAKGTLDGVVDSLRNLKGAWNIP